MLATEIAHCWKDLECSHRRSLTSVDLLRSKVASLIVPIAHDTTALLVVLDLKLQKLRVKEAYRNRRPGVYRQPPQPRRLSISCMRFGF